MRGGPALLLLLAFVLVLSGCAGPAAPAGSGSPTPVASGSEAALQVPTWALQDAWTYDVAGNPATYVVTGEQGGDWIVETDSPERAFQNARDDVSRLGPQRKSDLAGSQGSDRVEFFQWPLTENKTWTTRWDQQPVTITAHLKDGKARLEAVDANGTLVYRYTYDPKVGWFSALTHYNPDGSELIALQLTGSTHDWTGDIARWDLVSVASESGDLAAAHQSAVNFDVPLDATDVWADLRLVCSSGSMTIGVAPLPVAPSALGLEPRGAAVAASPACPADTQFTGSAGAPKVPPQGGAAETWGGSVVGAPGGLGAYHLEILVRTLTMTPVT